MSSRSPTEPWRAHPRPNPAGGPWATLPASVAAELAVHLEAQPRSTYVFGPDGDRPLLTSGWRVHVWRKAVAAAGPEVLRPHHLKHTGLPGGRRGRSK